MDLIKLSLNVTLRHALSESKQASVDLDYDSDDKNLLRSLNIPSARESDEPSTSDGRAELTPNRAIKKIKKKKKKYDAEEHGEQGLGTYGKELLDFSGPKLMKGIKNWFFMYKILGIINWEAPLYLSIAYKTVILVPMLYNIATRFTFLFSGLSTLRFQSTLKNPVFLFINNLQNIVIATQIIRGFKVNLFNLHPVYNVLTTPKLCFLREDVLHIIGSKSLKFNLLIVLFHCALMSSITKRDLEQFLDEFYLPTFLLDMHAHLVFHFYLMGFTYIDLYTRCAFGHWVLALKCYLEHKLTQLHRETRCATHRSAKRAGCVDRDKVTGILYPKQPSLQTNPPEQSPITFDEIRASLNNMDDHLEMMRAIQQGDLFLITLLAFLADGTALLLGYHLLVNESDLYHGIVFLLVALDYIFFISLTYSGDSWLFYAISSFTQTVEDEYFAQSSLCKFSINHQNQEMLKSEKPSAHNLVNIKNSQIVIDERASTTQSDVHESSKPGQLRIKKEDVLFCREFLHQFENHLATPYSKLNFTSHLRLIRAYFTLIAAQIIFDNENL